MITAPHYDHHEMMASRTAALGEAWLAMRCEGAAMPPFSTRCAGAASCTPAPLNSAAGEHRHEATVRTVLGVLARALSEHTPPRMAIFRPFESSVYMH